MTAIAAERRPSAHPDALAQVHCVRCDQAFLLDQPTVLRDGEWEHERCPAATEFALAPDRTVAPVSWSRRSLPAPMPPTPPTASDDVFILRAWMDAELSHPGDREAVLAAVATAVEHCEARRLGHPRLAAVYERVPRPLRPLFGTGDGGGLKLLLGRWEKVSSRETRFLAGLAGLTEDEATVYWWDLRGWQDWEIQRELTPKGLRQDRARWVAIDRVQDTLEAAHAKVLATFGLSRRQLRRSDSDVP